MKEKLSTLLRAIANKLDNETITAQTESNNLISKPDGKAEMLVFYSEEEEKRQIEIESQGISGLINKLNNLFK